MQSTCVVDPSDWDEAHELALPPDKGARLNEAVCDGVTDDAPLLAEAVLRALDVESVR